jgi:hypothetical protein
MSEITVKDLAKYVGKSGTWIFRHGENTVRLPVNIINAKMSFGNMRVAVKYARDQDAAWVNVDSVRVDWPLEEKANEEAWGDEYREVARSSLKEVIE